MKHRPTLEEYRQILRDISQPPDVISVSPAQALGLRLAKPVTLKGAFPDRPFALEDGLAVCSADVVAREGGEAVNGALPVLRLPGVELTSFIDMDGGRIEHEGGNGETGSLGSVSLKLRPPPRTNRREDAMQPGEAVAVGVGEEIPRGADLLYPLYLVAPAPQEQSEQDGQPAAEDGVASGNGTAGVNGEEQFVEPPRDWDLPARYGDGWVTLDRIPRTFRSHITIGAWSRSRESLINEKTVLRPSDLALLESAQVTEVEVFRRPTVGVADFSPPFPRAPSGDGNEEAAPAGPLGMLALQLVRAAQLPALALDNPPCDFRALARRVEHWLDQVDILLLVGGSHHGSRCIGRDIIGTLGEIVADGLELEPGGNLVAGRINNCPACALPGSLPEVLVAMVLGVRPLLYRNLEPPSYRAEIELELENGSSLKEERNRAVPVRFGFDRERNAYTSRYSGHSRDPWLDYIRGQALVVLEAGREYADWERVPATLY